MEDDKQRSATALGRAEFQIGEQNFRLASFNRRALLQIGIAFFVTGKEREKNSDRKKKKEREKEMQRRRDGEIKKNESEKEIGSNGERESCVADEEKCVGRREKSE